MRALMFLFSAVLTVSGCASSEPVDAVDRAERIAKLRKEAREEIFKLSAEERDLEDPAMWDKGIEVFERASQSYQKAVELGPFSFTTRYEYAVSLRGAGLLYLRKHGAAKQELDELEARGETPPPELAAAVSANWKAANNWLRRSCKEFEFYVDHIMKDSPNSDVYVALEENYRLLGDYPKALEAVRGFQREFGESVTPETRASLERAERWYVERIAEEEVAADRE